MPGKLSYLNAVVKGFNYEQLSVCFDNLKEIFIFGVKKKYLNIFKNEILFYKSSILDYSNGTTVQEYVDCR